MSRRLERITRLLESPVDLAPRALMLAAALLLGAVYLLPLWNLTMYAPQYPDGLRLDIYSYKLQGGNRGQDVEEINVLNHYIGMQDLVAEDFTEFKWMPFVVGALGLVVLRAAVQGQVGQVLDVFVLFGYFGAFSLWSFGYKMWSYGHSLAPTAAVKVEPFMPPMLGHARLANFDVYAYPGPATYAMLAAGAALCAALVLAWRDGHRRLAAA